MTVTGRQNAEARNINSLSSGVHYRQVMFTAMSPSRRPCEKHPEGRDGRIEFAGRKKDVMNDAGTGNSRFDRFTKGVRGASGVWGLGLDLFGVTVANRQSGRRKFPLHASRPVSVQSQDLIKEESRCWVLRWFGVCVKQCSM